MDNDIADRTILHVDLDAFFASVEQAMNPRLRGRPVIVGGRNDGRGVVCCASYEARPFGVRTGMPIAHARKLCPQAVFISGNYREYQRSSDAIMRLLFDYSPQVEIRSIDEACVDLTGTRRIHGGGRLRKKEAETCHGWAFAVAESIKRAVFAATGLNISIGIASSPVIAKIACSRAKPNGILQVISGGEAAFIADMPVGDMPGVGRATRARLKPLGIKTVADLRRLPRTLLFSMFGLYGAALYERCRGWDASAVTLNLPPKSFSRSTTFSRDTDDMETIEGMLYRLTEHVGASLRREDAAARCVHVELRYADFTDYRRSRHVRSAVSQDREIFALARPMLRGLYTRDMDLRKVGVGVSDLVSGAVFQSDLFSWEADMRRRRLGAALDRIRRAHGFDAVHAGLSIGLISKGGHIGRV